MTCRKFLHVFCQEGQEIPESGCIRFPPVLQDVGSDLVNAVVQPV